MGGRPKIPISIEKNNSTCEAFIAPIPPNQDLEYDIEVLSHCYEADPSKSAVEATLEIIMLRKDCGNRWFSYGDYSRAGRAYSKGAENAENYLKAFKDGVDPDPDDQSEEGIAKLRAKAVKDQPVVTAYITCLNNLAACYISKSDFLKAKEVSGST